MYFSFFFPFDGKTCFSAETNNFDEQMACRAPVRWLKYTTSLYVNVFVSFCPVLSLSVTLFKSLSLSVSLCLSLFLSRLHKQVRKMKNIILLLVIKKTNLCMFCILTSFQVRRSPQRWSKVLFLPFSDFCLPSYHFQMFVVYFHHHWGAHKCWWK